MATKTTVVTPERFAAGFTYADYIAQIKVNKERFDEAYQTFRLTAEDTEFFRKAAHLPNGPAKMLALAEDWCPDVVRGLPVMARMAEAAGMEMRVFARDQHLDIMNEFLNQGEFLSIPVAVFYTKEMQHISHWIERPALASRDQAEINAQVKKEMAGAPDTEIRAAARLRLAARFAAWQQESVREMREMLAPALRL